MLKSEIFPTCLVQSREQAARGLFPVSTMAFFYLWVEARAALCKTGPATCDKTDGLNCEGVIGKSSGQAGSYFISMKEKTIRLYI